MCLALYVALVLNRVIRYACMGICLYVDMHVCMKVGGWVSVWLYLFKGTCSPSLCGNLHSI